ncbi:hypothetical protein Tco_0478535 [Tanacetum coccineum]
MSISRYTPFGHPITTEAATSVLGGRISNTITAGLYPFTGVCSACSTGEKEWQPHYAHGELEQRCSAAPLLARDTKGKGARSARCEISQKYYTGQIRFHFLYGMSPDQPSRSKTPKQSKGTFANVRQDPVHLNAFRDQIIESSSHSKYPSADLTNTFFLTHTVGGVSSCGIKTEALYIMLRLQRLSSEHDYGVPYSEKNHGHVRERASSGGTFPVLVGYCRDAPRVDVRPRLNPLSTPPMLKSSKRVTTPNQTGEDD